jgi:ADP-ribose pyrophosphatase
MPRVRRSPERASDPLPLLPLSSVTETSAKLSSRRVYSGRILDVDIDTVRFPDGSVGELEMVRHSGASAVLPFLSDPGGDDPQVLLVRQYRYAAEDYIYEVPAGRLDPGESPIDCARRELEEETGCTAARVEPLTTIFTTPGFTDERIHLFMAVGVTHGEHRREHDEFMELETLTLSRALELVERGQITDAKTVVTLLYAAGYRAGR